MAALAASDDVTVPVWPRPRSITFGSATAAVHHSRLQIEHASGAAHDELLIAGIGRMKRNIFSFAANLSSAPLPYLRARLPGGPRKDATPPEARKCDTQKTKIFTTLRIEVAATSPTRLQHGVDESYELVLEAEGGTLRAPTEWGALRGLETFSQLVQYLGPAAGGFVLCGLPLRLVDSPAHAWRGLLLDTARHYMPLRAGILPLLDAMTAVKLNVLHWHLTDSSSFAMASTALPQLAQRGAWHPALTYSAEDMRAVVRAAWLRGIRVVPELDMPAHAASWSHAMPELVVACPRRVAADSEGFEHGLDKPALNPLVESTYDAVGALLAEMAEIFPDEWLHLGGDEVDGECWLEAPDVRKWAKGRRGGVQGNWKAELQALFTARVLRTARALGKRVMLWDDALEMAALLPEELRHVGIDVWRDWVRTTGERHETAARAGHPTVWSTLAWYQDLPANTWDAIYKASFPSASRRSELMGGETSLWAEHLDATNLQERALMRAAAAAERLWSGAPSELDVARQRLASMRCRLLRRGLRPSPVIPDHCDAGTFAPADSAALADPEPRGGLQGGSTGAGGDGLHEDCPA